jgi:hypothetical protein
VDYDILKWKWGSDGTKDVWIILAKCVTRSFLYTLKLELGGILSGYAVFVSVQLPLMLPVAAELIYSRTVPSTLVQRPVKLIAVW